MAYSAAQLKQAIASAKANNDAAAVQDLEARLAALSANAYAKDDGTAWMANYNPADEESSTSAGLIGAGRTVDKFITGVSDLFADDVEQARTATEQRANDLAYANLQDEFPVSTTVGEIAGYAPTMMVPGGAAAQIAVGGLSGAAMYNTPEDRAKQGAIDAGLSALPYAAGKVLKKAVGAAGTRLSGRADDLGWKLTPGEKLNSPALRNIEASMESFPPTAGPIRKLKAPRQEAMNRTALKAIGEDGTDFASNELLAARARTGQVFDDTIQANSFPIDDKFLNTLGMTEGKAMGGLLGGGDTGKIIDNVLEIAAKGDGTISGRELQAWRTTLQTQASKAYRSDSATKEYADALDSIVDAIDDLVERNLSEADLADWQKARKQWTAIKQLEKSKAINEAGNVSGRKLGNSLSSQDMQGYYRGANQSDLYDAARISKVYPPMADSGTASRLSIPMMLATPPAYLGGANLAARAYANPEATARMMMGIARGGTQEKMSEDERQRMIADQLRRTR